MDIGRITIDYTVTDEGDLQTSYTVDGDLPIVTQLGIIELAKDTILHPPADED